MHITFGLALDGRQCPPTHASLDAPSLGLKGLLALLETCLGLTAPEIDPTRRVARY